MHVSRPRVGGTRSTEIEYLEKRETGDLSISPANVYYLFAGAIPAQLGGLDKLTWLSLSYNQLSGERLIEFEYFIKNSHNLFMCHAGAGKMDAN